MNAFADPDDQLMQETVTCAVCGENGHSLYSHIMDAHKLSAEEYTAKYPGHPLLSAFAKKVQSGAASPVAIKTDITNIDVSSMAVFGIGFGKGSDKDRPIKGYTGYTAADGKPSLRTMRTLRISGRRMTRFATRRTLSPSALFIMLWEVMSGIKRRADAMLSSGRL